MCLRKLLYLIFQYCCTCLYLILFAYIQEGHFKHFEIQLPDSPNSLFILRIASYIWQRDNQIPSWILIDLDQNE